MLSIRALIQICIFLYVGLMFGRFAAFSFTFLGALSDLIAINGLTKPRRPIHMLVNYVLQYVFCILYIAIGIWLVVKESQKVAASVPFIMLPVYIVTNRILNH